jgi:hypothetical protein
MTMRLASSGFMSVRFLCLALLTIVLAGLTSLALASASHAQVSAALNQKASEAANIVATAEQKGHVRVIIEFAAPVPPNQMRPDPAFLAPVRAEIAANQGAIIGGANLASTPQGFERGLVRMDVTPHIAVNVTAADWKRWRPIAACCAFRKTSLTVPRSSTAFR